jgi:TetR/AcrR family transcriptional regulator, transcriptional repressor for nem operon
MRYPNEHKEQTRQRVLKEAAAAIRAAGPDGVGVAEVMAKAGLTHGAFYAHFESKDDLIAQAIAYMFAETRQKFVTRTEDPDPAIALRNYIDMYLSSRHRDAPAGGCPLPSLSGELARLPGEARAQFTSGLKALTALMTKRIEQLGRADAGQLATSAVAEMVGAMALARATDDPAQSDQILRNSRAAIKARLAIA